MGLFQNEFPRFPKNYPLPLSKIRVKPFDVETTLAEVKLERKNRAKKYHGPDSPLYSAIYPSVCIMKVFGLAPYDFTGDEMTPSNLCLVFSFAFMCIYCYIVYIVYLKFTSLKRQKQMLNVVETTKVIVNFLVAMYELVSTVFTRRVFSRIWNALQDSDERMSQLGYPRKETKTKIAMWTLLISQIIVWTVVNQSGMYALMEAWFFNVSYICVYLGTAIPVYKFFGMTSFLGQRFHQLNQIARENLPPRVGYKSSSVSKKTIQDLHDKLMLSSEELASLYSWSLLFWLGNLSVHSVSNLYFIIDWLILMPWTNIAWLRVFNMWSWEVGFISQLLVIYIACDYTITEANSMGAIFVEWDARVIQRFPYDDTVRTSLPFLNRRLSFSAGGLFNVHLPLLCSMVGVLSTYLVLLLQFPA
ncbi:PREDICTED: putative gustatory receptor 2a [Habropoda laboriosa]|uniref:putative gustatory receptor 2a n=1 Tax=Habropoda laboriosa TaxID=597456 RepID=UPI00083CC7A4|nr:PREDICTED: putative gustatory receptor 2a [Habropoda laboriosa]